MGDLGGLGMLGLGVGVQRSVGVRGTGVVGV